MSLLAFKELEPEPSSLPVLPGTEALPSPSLGQCQPGFCRVSFGCPNINTGTVPPAQVKYVSVITHKSDNPSFMVNFHHTIAGGTQGL